DADLQHHAARHARGLVAPRREVDLAEAVAADVGLRVHEAPEAAGVDLVADPAEVALAAALVAERQDDLRIAARLRERARAVVRVRDGLVEEHVLARRGRGARGLQVRGVRRRVDDGVDARVAEDLLVRARRAASVLRGELRALLGGAAVARLDAQLAAAHD